METGQGVGGGWKSFPIVFIFLINWSKGQYVLRMQCDWVRETGCLADTMGLVADTTTQQTAWQRAPWV